MGRKVDRAKEALWLAFQAGNQAGNIAPQMPADMAFKMWYDKIEQEHNTGTMLTLRPMGSIHEVLQEAATRDSILT